MKSIAMQPAICYIKVIPDMCYSPADLRLAPRASVPKQVHGAHEARIQQSAVVRIVSLMEVVCCGLSIKSI
jgi:hypothetical protein